MTARNGYVAFGGGSYTSAELEAFTDEVFQVACEEDACDPVEKGTIAVHGSGNFNIRLEFETSELNEDVMDAMCKGIRNAGFKVLRVGGRGMNAHYKTCYPLHFQVHANMKGSLNVEAWF